MFLAAPRLLSLGPCLTRPLSTAPSWVDSVRDGFAGTVGKTPLIRLRGPSEATGCEIRECSESSDLTVQAWRRSPFPPVIHAEELSCGVPG